MCLQKRRVPGGLPQLVQGMRGKRLRRSPSGISGGSEDDRQGSDDDCSLAALVSPTWDTTKVRLTETSRDARQLNPHMIACLGIIKHKGRKSSKTGQKKETNFKRGRAVMTRWGPGILMARCHNGWNVDFRDEHPGGWYVEHTDFVACMDPRAST